MSVRSFIIAASAILLVLCIAAIPVTAPAFAFAFGPLAALVSSSLLGLCAVAMAYNVVTFTFRYQG